MQHFKRGNSPSFASWNPTTRFSATLQSSNYHSFLWRLKMAKWDKNAHMKCFSINLTTESLPYTNDATTV